MTSTGSVEQIIPSRYLLIIVARVIAATKCKLCENCGRGPSRSLTTLSRRAELGFQRIHMLSQANCVTIRRLRAQRPRQVVSSVECIRRYGNRCAAPMPRKADLLSRRPSAHDAHGRRAYSPRTVDSVKAMGSAAGADRAQYSDRSQSDVSVPSGQYQMRRAPGYDARNGLNRSLDAGDAATRLSRKDFWATSAESSRSQLWPSAGADQLERRESCWRRGNLPIWTPRYRPTETRLRRRGAAAPGPSEAQCLQPPEEERLCREIETID